MIDVRMSPEHECGFGFFNNYLYLFWFLSNASIMLCARNGFSMLHRPKRLNQTVHRLAHNVGELRRNICTKRCYSSATTSDHIDCIDSECIFAFLVSDIETPETTRHRHLLRSQKRKVRMLTIKERYEMMPHSMP